MIFCCGPLSSGKHNRNEFDPVFEAPRFGPRKLVSQNSTPNSGFGGAKSPVQKSAPENMKLKQRMLCNGCVVYLRLVRERSV